MHFVFPCVCKDLYETLFGGSSLPFELKFQISWKSDLLLRRYLQNNTDICLIPQLVYFQKSSPETWGQLNVLGLGEEGGGGEQRNIKYVAFVGGSTLQNLQQG